MNLQQLKFEVLDLKKITPQNINKAEAAYLFWKTQWTHFLKEHQISEHLFGDEFTRADAAGILYYNGLIASIILYKERDLRCSFWRDDSYFEVWPQNLITQLVNQNISKVMSAGFLTVHPLMRGEQFQPSLKNIMVTLVSHHLTTTQADAAVCVTNNLKGVNSSTERNGWELLATGLEHFQHPVNLYVLSKDKALTALKENTPTNKIVHHLMQKPDSFILQTA